MTTSTCWDEQMKVNGITAITRTDADLIRRTLAPKRPAKEQLAVESWLAAGHRPTKVPTGKSGLYDEFGVPTARSDGAGGFRGRFMRPAAKQNPRPVSAGDS